MVWPIALALWIACGIPAFAKPPAGSTDAAENKAKTTTPFVEPEQRQAALAVIKAQPQLPLASESRAKLNEILARPEFTTGSAAPKTNWLQRFLEWLSRTLGRFGVKTPGWVGIVAIVFVVTALVYLITRVIWEWQARRSRQPAPDAALDDIILGTDALLKAVAEAEARGDYRTAIRLRFRWLLSALDLGESALLTNRQLIARLAREHPVVREPLKQLVTCFEDAWYGGLPCGRSDVEQAASLAASVRDNVREVQP
jgi:hypothetical protein